MGWGGGNHTTLFAEWVKRQHTEAWTQLLYLLQAAPGPPLPAAPPRQPLPRRWPAGPAAAAAAKAPFLLGSHAWSSVISVSPHPLLDLTTLACISPVSSIPTTLSQGSKSSLFLMYKNTLLWRLEKVAYTQHLFTSCDSHTSKNKHIFILSLIFGATYT